MVLHRILGAIFRYSVSKGKVLAAASEWVDGGRMYEYPETVSGNGFYWRLLNHLIWLGKFAILLNGGADTAPVRAVLDSLYLAQCFQVCK